MSAIRRVYQRQFAIPRAGCSCITPRMRILNLLTEHSQWYLGQ